MPRWSQKYDDSFDPANFRGFFDASLGTEVDTDLCGPVSSDVLELRGLFIERPDLSVVTGLSETCEELTSFFQEGSRFLSLNLLSEVQNDAHSILWRVLVAGADNSDGIAPERMAHTFQAFRRYYQEHQEIPPRPEELPVDASEEMVALSNYRAAMQLACRRRRLFITAGGRLGLGPQTMRPGDVAVVLCGGNVPFILRYHEDANDYEFIGECYIDGIMFGEAVQKHREEGREDVIFNIR